MTNLQPMSKQRVRFEEVTPANTVVAFFEIQLKPLAALLQVPIFDGYDDLDEMRFTLSTLPSGHTVTMQEYEHAPRSGVNLYVDNSISNISEVVFEACQKLEVPRSKVIWFHPDFQIEIDHLYTKHKDIVVKRKPLRAKKILASSQYEPINCFQYALRIYRKQDYPQYWAMLQHNLGLAYFDRSQGDRGNNLRRSIKCFKNSLEIYTQDDFPEQWKINQHDLKQSQHSLRLWPKQSLAIDINSVAIQGRELKGVNLIGSNLSNANLSFANLSFAKLGCVDLSDANLVNANLTNAKLGSSNLSGTRLNEACLHGADLSVADLINAILVDADLTKAILISANLNGANLSRADLSGANLKDINLSNANVKNTKFKSNLGISEVMKQDLIERGAIFDDAPGDRSRSRNLVPR
jgi:uncharacterized protein YjbI with pentapeptide repeats